MAWWPKVQNSKSLGFLHSMLRQERELWLPKRCTAVLICKRRPAACSVHKLHWVHRGLKNKREAEQTQRTLQYFVGRVVTYNVTCMTSTRAWSVSPSRRLQSIRISIARCFRSRLALTAFSMTASSRSKVMWRKKERKKNDQFGVFRVERFWAVPMLIRLH